MAIASVTLDDPDARALIAELNRELSATYPEEGATHFRLDPDEVGPGRGAFLVARADGAPIACGVVRLIEPNLAELKRMYTRPAARGRGHARALLSSLEEVARDLGATRLVLETGTRQLAAIAIYQRAGFTRIPPFGEYVDSPLSVCMGKPLVER